MIKADLPQLESLSRRLGVCSGDVADLKANLSALINGTDWEGGAATRFRTAWESQFRPALDEMSTALTDASSEVNTRKMALDRAGN
jgi:WXG100 family type VII secretion target